MRALRKQVTGKLKTVGILHTHNRYGPVELRKMKDTTMQLVKAGHVVAHGHKVLDSHDRTFDGEAPETLDRGYSCRTFITCTSALVPSRHILRLHVVLTERRSDCIRSHSRPLTPLSLFPVYPPAHPPHRDRGDHRRDAAPDRGT